MIENEMTCKYWYADAYSKNSDFSCIFHKYHLRFVSVSKKHSNSKLPEKKDYE